MKVIILTSSDYGTAPFHLPLLIESGVCEVSMVVLSKGQINNKKRYYKKKLQKTFKIGILGMINGMRMRKWLSKDLSKCIKQDSLITICKQHNIPFYTTPQINCENTIELFKNADADIGLSLGNVYIGKKVFTIPKYGMLNIHHEILPEYQNAPSIIWQIYNGSINTGYTIHAIDQNIDTGKILFKQQVPIIFKETLGDTVTHTFVELLKNSSKGLIKVISEFEELYNNAQSQPKGKTYTTPSIWQFLKIYINYRKLKKRYSS